MLLIFKAEFPARLTPPVTVVLRAQEVKLSNIKGPLFQENTSSNMTVEFICALLRAICMRAEIFSLITQPWDFIVRMRYNLNARTDCQFVVHFISSPVSELVSTFQNQDLFAQISSQLCKFLVCNCICRRVFWLLFRSLRFHF